MEPVSLTLSVGKEEDMRPTTFDVMSMELKQRERPIN